MRGYEDIDKSEHAGKEDVHRATQPVDLDRAQAALDAAARPNETAAKGQLDGAHQAPHGIQRDEVGQ